jgi:predicted RNA methylase
MIEGMSTPYQLVVEGLDHQREVLAHRSDSVYRVHAYHTKVPPSVASSYMERYSEPGDLVLDPFCGSGMTGVAAALCGRRAYLNDLSPAAVHITSNYTEPCSPDLFRAGVERVLGAVGEQIAAEYETVHEGRPAKIEYLVWSDLRGCPSCGEEILLWDRREEGLRRLECRNCGHQGPKSEFPVVGERAVEANLSAGGGREVRGALPGDLGDPPLRSDLPWFPEVPFGSERPMWRRGHEELGIRSVADFYSPRNLAAMALLWDAAGAEPDERVHSALRFSLTAIANRASRRYQWNPKRPTNVLGGTLYVSSLRYEWNVLSLWRRKTAAVERFFRDNPMPAGAVEVHEGSATALSLPDASIDYCFTDPPFGAHIVYSDSSLLWEAWLDDLTDRDREAIVVSGGDRPKDVDAYGGLLEGSFAEIHRVLKPGGRATVIFQATDPAVWRAIQTAAANAGLRLLEASSLDKGQPSFKQIKGRGGERVAEADVILTFERQAAGEAEPVDTLPEPSPLAILRGALEDAGTGSARPTAGKLYARVNARLLSSGASEILSYGALLDLLEEEGVKLAIGQGSPQ